MIKNSVGANIKICCASCKYKEYTNSEHDRFCKKRAVKVKNTDECSLWKISNYIDKIRAGV